MIYPTTTDLLRSTQHALESSMDDAIPRTSVKSALATCSHIVRYVDLRLERERGLLIEDVGRTTELVAAIVAYLESLPDPPIDLIGYANAAQRSDGNVAARTDTAEIAEHALRLRETVYRALALLQEFDAEMRSADGYVAIRAAIRDYIKLELEAEDVLIHDAFAGRGPRR
jgi:hypothetical protein